MKYSTETDNKKREIAVIDGVNLILGNPDRTDIRWIGEDDILKQLLACWLIVDEKDMPLSPRITGTPGIGKTTLAMAAAKLRKQPLYIFQCTADTRPEDLLITPVLSESGKIAYHTSPLVSAMITGGICILDEGNRMNEKSWASLAPLLDHRRYVESIIAGITIHANREFRGCVTMNDDESTFEIPDYIMSRLQPTLSLGFPDKKTEMAILQYHLPFAEDNILELTVNFLQRSHQLNLDFSPRDGIHLLQYTIKRLFQDPKHPLSKDGLWREAIKNVLGEDALDLDRLAEKKKKILGENGFPLGLGDFFFDSDSPLHPDSKNI